MSDKIYENIYDCNRNALIFCLRKEDKNNKLDDKQLGDIIDGLADAFNKDERELVNNYKPVVDELYSSWKENPDTVYEFYSEYK